MNHATMHIKFNEMPSALAPFKHDSWPAMRANERLRRCLRMRRLIPNPQKVHDQKIFPAIDDG